MPRSRKPLPRVLAAMFTAGMRKRYFRSRAIAGLLGGRSGPGAGRGPARWWIKPCGVRRGQGASPGPLVSADRTQSARIGLICSRVSSFRQAFGISCDQPL